MGIFRYRDKQFSRKKVAEEGQSVQVVSACYCPNGHNLISDLASFGGHGGITVKLRSASQEGVLSISPIIGDKSRTFFDFERHEGEVIQILCPTCDAELPVYTQCPCGADLIALFSSPEEDFADCIGICQRIGCLNSEILTSRALRLYIRNGVH